MVTVRISRFGVVHIRHLVVGELTPHGVIADWRAVCVSFDDDEPRKPPPIDKGWLRVRSSWCVGAVWCQLAQLPFDMEGSAFRPVGDVLP
jgi:hypothetical protein